MTPRSASFRVNGCWRRPGDMHLAAVCLVVSGGVYLDFLWEHRMAGISADRFWQKRRGSEFLRQLSSDAHRPIPMRTRNSNPSTANTTSALICRPARARAAAARRAQRAHRASTSTSAPARMTTDFGACRSAKRRSQALDPATAARITRTDLKAPSRTTAQPPKLLPASEFVAVKFGPRSLSSVRAGDCHSGGSERR